GAAGELHRRRCLAGFSSWSSSWAGPRWYTWPGPWSPSDDRHIAYGSAPAAPRAALVSPPGGDDCHLAAPRGGGCYLHRPLPLLPYFEARPPAPRLRLSRPLP